MPPRYHEKRLSFERLKSFSHQFLFCHFSKGTLLTCKIFLLNATCLGDTVILPDVVGYHKVALCIGGRGGVVWILRQLETKSTPLYWSGVGLTGDTSRTDSHQPTNRNLELSKTVFASPPRSVEQAVLAHVRRPHLTSRYVFGCLVPSGTTDRFALSSIRVPGFYCLRDKGKPDLPNFYGRALTEE